MTTTTVAPVACATLPVVSFVPAGTVLAIGEVVARMPVYEFEGRRPVVDPAAFVHPTAVLIGDVVVGAQCYVGPLAVLRADYGRIVMEPGSNLQDTCAVHVSNGGMMIESDGHIGHGVVLHGGRIGRGSLIGMGAVLMGGVDIGDGAFVGAQSYVPPGFAVPERHLALGTPVRVTRELTEPELQMKVRWTAEYHELARRSLAGMREVESLTEEEPDRPRPGRRAQSQRAP